MDVFGKSDSATGAGMIMIKNNNVIKGLTTAAGVWTTSIIGIDIEIDKKLNYDLISLCEIEHVIYVDED